MREEIEYFPTGEKRWRKCFERNSLDSHEGPAVTRWTRHGTIWLEAYYCTGALHREEAPAVRTWSQSKERKLLKEEYFCYGRRHREDGPAVIDRGQRSYFLSDIEISLSRFSYLMNLSPFERFVLLCRSGKCPSMFEAVYSDDEEIVRRRYALHKEYLRASLDDTDFLVRLARVTDGHPKILAMLHERSGSLVRSVEASLQLCA